MTNSFIRFCYSWKVLGVQRVVALTNIFLEDTLLMETIQAVNTKCHLMHYNYLQ